MILDFIMVLVVAVFIFIGYKIGIMKALYGFLSIIVAGVSSYLLSGLLAKLIYNTFFADSVNDSISNSLNSFTHNATATSEEVFHNLPDYVADFLRFFGVNDNSLYNSLETTEQIIVSDVQNTVMSAVVSILGVMIMIVLFVLILVLLKLLSRYILFIFNLPLIKQINGLLGGAFGLAEGLIICYIAVLVCRVILPMMSQPVITADMINESVLFGKIYYSEFIGFVAEAFSSAKSFIF